MIYCWIKTDYGMLNLYDKELFAVCPNYETAIFMAKRVLSNVPQKYIKVERLLGGSITNFLGSHGDCGYIDTGCENYNTTIPVNELIMYFPFKRFNVRVEKINAVSDLRSEATELSCRCATACYC